MFKKIFILKESEGSYSDYTEIITDVLEGPLKLSLENLRKEYNSRVIELKSEIKKNWALLSEQEKRLKRKAHLQSYKDIGSFKSFLIQSYNFKEHSFEEEQC